jgi:hypothetical protein
MSQLFVVLLFGVWKGMVHKFEYGFFENEVHPVVKLFRRILQIPCNYRKQGEYWRQLLEPKKAMRLTPPEYFIEFRSRKYNGRPIRGNSQVASDICDIIDHFFPG